MEGWRYLFSSREMPLKQISHIARPLLLLLLSCIGADVLHAQVAIVAHSDVQASDIERSDLLDIWTRDVRNWGDDTPIVVFDQKQKGQVRDVFYAFLGVRPSRMKSIWLKQLYAGEGQPPQTVDSPEEMLERVQNTPGAIGYVQLDLVEGGAVKILMVLPLPGVEENE